MMDKSRIKKALAVISVIDLVRKVTLRFEALADFDRRGMRLKPICRRVRQGCAIFLSKPYASGKREIHQWFSSSGRLVKS